MCATGGRMACAPVVLGQWHLTAWKQASCWEVSGQRRVCSRVADMIGCHKGSSGLINEGIWKAISGSRFAFNHPISQNSFNSLCSTHSTKCMWKHWASGQWQAAYQQEVREEEPYKLQMLFLCYTLDKQRSFEFRAARLQQVTSLDCIFATAFFFRCKRKFSDKNSQSLKILNVDA